MTAIETQHIGPTPSVPESSEAQPVANGIKVSTSNLSYYIPVKNKRKALLQDISFQAQPGEVLYIMGPSGAGKSTLLDLLGRRTPRGFISGQIWFNDIPQENSWKVVQSNIAYVRQGDVHVAVLTVRESFEYAAAFHLKANRSNRQRRVEEVANLLGLTQLMETRVGNALDRGISGGQLKRLSIGVEIMATPALLFLDEPTSGLDSVMALEVMSFVNGLARSWEQSNPQSGPIDGENRRGISPRRTTVISTIHQPSEAVLSLSDHLIILADGRLCYEGPTSQACGYFRHLCTQGLIAPDAGAGVFANPADFLLSIASVPGLGADQLFKLHVASQSTPQVEAKLEHNLDKDVAVMRGNGHTVPGHYAKLGQALSFPPPQDRISLLTQIAVLVRRGWKVMLRQPIGLQAIYGREVLSGILYGIIYYQQGHRSKADPAGQRLTPSALNTISLLYFTVYNLFWANMETMHQFFAWRGLFQKERDGQAYSTLAFLLASPVILLPFVGSAYFLFLLLADLLGAIPQQLIHAPTALLVQLVTLFTAYFFAKGVSARLKRPELSYVVVPILFVTMGSLTGFMVASQDMPSFWQQVQKVVFTRYAYEAVLLIQFRDRADKDLMLERVGFRQSGLSVGTCIGVLWLFCLLFAINEYDALRLRTPRLIRLDKEQCNAKELCPVHNATYFSDWNKAQIRDSADSMADLKMPLLMGEVVAGILAVDHVCPVRPDAPPPLCASHVNQANDGVDSLFRQEDGRGALDEEMEETENQIDVTHDVDVGDDVEGGRVQTTQPDQQKRLLFQAPSLGLRKQSSMVKEPSRLSLQDFLQRSSSLPPGAGGYLYFREIGCSVQLRGRGREGNQQQEVREQTILYGNITGAVGPREVLAVMGPSGAGKTTLLDILAHRKTVGRLSGHMAMTSGIRRTAYVTQDDVHLSTLTVQETLFYAALLRMEEEVSRLDRSQRVEDIACILGLDKIRDVLVGDSFHRGISGGQKRRLTIGVEIMNLPDLIFLDEPTTGLDSATALEVMNAVRGLADPDRAVVLTVHQPSAEIYGLFDKLTLLSGGYCIYHGPAASAMKYFTSSPFHLDTKSALSSLRPSPSKLSLLTSQGTTHEKSAGDREINPADYVMLVASCLIPLDGQASRPATSEQLATVFEESSLGARVQLDVPELAALVEIKRVTTVERRKAKRRFPRSLLSQILILNRRHLSKISKDRRALLLNNTSFLVLGLFWSSLIGHGPQGVSEAQNRLALLYFSTCIVSFSNQNAMPALFELRPLFYRERGAGLYSSIAHCVSLDTPYVVINLCTSLLFASLPYNICGLRDGAGHWAFYYLTLILLSMTSLSIIVFLSSITPSIRELSAIWSFLGYVITVTTGFMSRIPTLPNWAQYATLASFTRWGFQGLSINQYGGSGPESNPQFLSDLGFAEYNKWYTPCVLLGILVSLRAGLIIATRLLNFEKR